MTKTKKKEADNGPYCLKKRMTNALKMQLNGSDEFIMNAWGYFWKLFILLIWQTVTEQLGAHDSHKSHKNLHFNQKKCTMI